MESRPRDISRPFSRLMSALISSLILVAVLGLTVLQYVIRNSVLKDAANNYARFAAYQIADLAGRLDDPGRWRSDAEGLSSILARASRARGVAAIRVLGPDGRSVAERAAEEAPYGVVQGREPIIFSNRTLGWVLVSLAVPELEEPWGGLGFLTIAHLATLTARDYGVLVSDQVAALIGELAEPEMWEYDADKLSVILTDALRLDGICRVAILDRRGAVVAEKRREQLKGYATDVQTSIVYDDRTVGHVEVHLDFPGIRATARMIQTGTLCLILLLGAALYLLSTRTVRGLESSLVELYAGLETKVRERTEQLGKANERLNQELAERKRLEASLIQSEKIAAVGQLAAGVAHEINNPMGIILGFAQSAVRRVEEGDPLALPLKSIEREAIRCKELVQNLLVFSRSSKPEQREETDINACVQQALSLVQAQARIKDTEVLRELEQDPPKLRANKNQLQQVVLNLCNNAMDAMPKGGTLTIRTGTVARDGALRARLEVSDTGTGIPEELRSKIFEPFFTTKEAGKGTGLGLGLALVYEIVQKHQGTIDVDSAVGRGTRFVVTLPAERKI